MSYDQIPTFFVEEAKVFPAEGHGEVIASLAGGSVFRGLREDAVAVGEADLKGLEIACIFRVLADALQEIALALPGEVEVFRADAKCHFFPRSKRREDVIRHPDRGAAEEEDVSLPPCGDEVHRRRSDEGRHEGIGRAGVDFLGRGDLLEFSIVEDRDALADGHGFDLVVGDVDHGGMGDFMDAYQFLPRPLAELGVQIGERFIEQEIGGMFHDGPAERHPLFLPAGEGTYRLGREIFEMQHGKRFLRALFDFCLRQFLDFEPESDVVPHVHVGKEGVALEHHGHVPLTWRHIIHPLSAEVKVAVGDGFEARDHAERGGFPAARRTQENDPFPFADFKIQFLDDVFVSIRFAYVFEGELSN